MVTDFQRVRFMFPAKSGSAQSLEQTVYFPTAVQKAEAAINGFSVGFSSADHHLFRQQVDTTVTRIYVGSVTVRVDFALRDSSGFFDDPYDGYVDVVVIVNRA